MLYNRPVRLSYLVVLRSAAYFTVPLLAVVVPPLLETGEINIGTSLRALGWVLLGWTLVVWLPLNRDVDRPAQEWNPTTRVLLVVIVTTLALAALRHSLIVAEFAVLQDEVLYLLQSAWLTTPGSVGSSIHNCFPFSAPSTRLLRDNIPDDALPAGLASFAGGVSLGRLSVVEHATACSDYRVVDLFDWPRVAFAKGWIFCRDDCRIQPLILGSADGYMSHAISTAFVTGAAYRLLRGDRAA